jgi:hypothetical protein
VHGGKYPHLSPVASSVLQKFAPVHDSPPQSQSPLFSVEPSVLPQSATDLQGPAIAYFTKTLNAAFAVAKLSGSIGPARMMHNPLFELYRKALQSA